MCSAYINVENRRHWAMNLEVLVDKVDFFATFSKVYLRGVDVYALIFSALFPLSYLSWCLGVIVSGCHGVRVGDLVSSCLRVLVSWCLGVLGGVLVSWCHDVSVSWSFGVLVSWFLCVLVCWCVGVVVLTLLPLLRCHVSKWLRERRRRLKKTQRKCRLVLKSRGTLLHTNLTASCVHSGYKAKCLALN